MAISTSSAYHSEALLSALAERARELEEWAKTAADVDPSDARKLWQVAASGVKRSASYGGLELTPQEGLLPLGPDASSELWEFAHLASGEPARRRPDGALEVGEATGIVLVLVPSQAGHPPFFIAKHAVTAAQLGGAEPTAEALGALGLAVPTEGQKARAAFAGWTRAEDGVQPVRALDSR